jgi:hypothetical protein
LYRYTIAFPIWDTFSVSWVILETPIAVSGCCTRSWGQPYCDQALGQASQYTQHIVFKESKLQAMLELRHYFLYAGFCTWFNCRPSSAACLMSARSR